MGKRCSKDRYSQKEGEILLREYECLLIEFIGFLKILKDMGLLPFAGLAGWIHCNSNVKILADINIISAEEADLFLKDLIHFRDK